MPLCFELQMKITKYIYGLCVAYCHYRVLNMIVAPYSLVGSHVITNIIRICKKKYNLKKKYKTNLQTNKMNICEEKKLSF